MEQGLGHTIQSGQDVLGKVSRFIGLTSDHSYS